MTIIDPPSELEGLSAWARFRREMERLVMTDGDNAEAKQWLIEARRIEAEKRA